MDNFVIPDIQSVSPGIAEPYAGGVDGGSQIVIHSVGNGLYQMQLPDGSTQIVNGVGEIISSN